MSEQAGVPEALTVPTSQWLSQNNYTALPVIFNRGMAAYGYGDLRETPIVSVHLADDQANQLTLVAQLYMLQYFTPDIVRFASGIDPANLIGKLYHCGQFAAFTAGRDTNCWEY